MKRFILSLIFLLPPTATLTSNTSKTDKIKSFFNRIDCPNIALLTLDCTCIAVFTIETLLKESPVLPLPILSFCGALMTKYILFNNTKKSITTTKLKSLTFGTGTIMINTCATLALIFFFLHPESISYTTNQKQRYATGALIVLLSATMLTGSIRLFKPFLLKKAIEEEE